MSGVPSRCLGRLDHHVDLIGPHRAGSQPGIGNCRLRGAESDLEGQRQRVVLLHDLARRDVGDHRSETDAIKRDRVARLSTARGCPSKRTGGKNERHAIRKSASAYTTPARGV